MKRVDRRRIRLVSNYWDLHQLRTSQAIGLIFLLTGSLLQYCGPTYGQAPVHASTSDPLVLTVAQGDEQLARKMSGRLMQLRLDVIEGATPKSAAQSRTPQSLRNDKLQVILVVSRFSNDLLEATKTAGLEVVGQHDLPMGIKHLVVRCASPLQLDPMLQRTDVILATPEPRRITRAGSVTSQGDLSLRANLARATFGISGTGIRIGILSDTFNRTIGGTNLGAYGSGTVTGSTPQTHGDIPSTVRVIDAGPNDGTGSDEGAAMAEIIHDVAPGSPLSFASAFGGYSEFATNITKLRTDPGFNCKVLVDDVGYYNEPIFQHGLIDLAANQCYAAGVPYFSALGNDYNDAHEADYADTNTATDTAYPPTGVDFHDFGTAKGTTSDKFLTFSLAPGITLSCLLKWDEPGNGSAAAGPGSQSDLNLYILSSTALPVNAASILDQGIDVQGTVGSPSGEPYEEAFYTNNSSSNKTVHVTIDHRRGRNPVHLHLMAYTNGPYSGYTDRALDTGRTAFGHPVATGVMGIAAVRYKEIDTDGSVQPPGGTINVEPFSSLAGSSPLYISDDGLIRYSTPLTRFKPDVAAPDGTNTSFFPAGSDDSDDADSYPNFYGTSAAAPHAAAVAALMWQAKPTLTSSQLYSLMRSTARDIEASGVDASSGNGLLDAYSAVSAALASGVEDWSLY